MIAGVPFTVEFPLKPAFVSLVIMLSTALPRRSRCSALAVSEATELVEVAESEADSEFEPLVLSVCD